MKINKRIIKAIAIKTKEVEVNGEMVSRETKKAKISIPDGNGGYKEVWPMITDSTKNAELIEKGATLNLYLSDDEKFINAAFTWEPREGGNADDMGVDAGSYADSPF